MEPLLTGAYDLHVHCSPDVVPRAQDAFDLASDAQAAGMAGIGLKDHTTSTVGRCHILRRAFPEGPRFFSSIVLNPPVGGLNPAAVETALACGADIVYLPTYSAAHHIELVGEHTTPVPHTRDGVQRLSLLDDRGRILREVQTIIELIATYDAVLATGHISPRESLAVLSNASASGVRRMVVTHASQSVPAMSIEDQKQAVALGAMIEHCFLAVTDCCPGSIPIETMAHQIRSVGCDHVILSSDFGQPANGSPIEVFAQYVRELQRMGFDDRSLRIMLSANPARLVENRKGKRP